MREEFTNDINTEGFIDTEIIAPDQIYDKFYSNIYDKLFYTSYKTEFEIGDLIENFLSKMDKKQTSVLDIGCGTGKHIKLLNEREYSVIGLDNSNEMLKIAKENNPEVRFVLGNAMDKNVFSNTKFDIITCYYFTIYYMKHIDEILNNVYNWLKPSGVFVVHIVNKDKFDPILEPASPFPAFSLQKYSKKRVMSSTVTFNNFEYNAEFKLMDNNKAHFNEQFVLNKKKKIRKQTHILYMFNIKDFILTMKNKHFKLIGKTDLVSCSYEYHYLFYFRKI